MAVVRAFAGIDLPEGSVADGSTIQSFHHLLEEKKLSEKILKVMNQCLEDHDLLMRKGTVVDATIINGPRSTTKRERDGEMHSCRKGNQWFFRNEGPHWGG